MRGTGMTLRNRRRLRRGFGWALMTVGGIGFGHPDIPSVFPLLVGLALLHQGSGGVRRLMRRIDRWWRGRRDAMKPIRSVDLSEGRVNASCWGSGHSLTDPREISRKEGVSGMEMGRLGTAMGFGVVLAILIWIFFFSQ